MMFRIKLKQLVAGIRFITQPLVDINMQYTL